MCGFKKLDFVVKVDVLIFYIFDVINVKGNLFLEMMVVIVDVLEVFFVVLFEIFFVGMDNWDVSLMELFLKDDVKFGFFFGFWCVFGIVMEY